MNARDVIESYVTDVAVQLPARQRADVAAELQSLLCEELAGGDAAAALALVRRFGRPADVAARYHQPYAIVEPSDTRGFIVAAVFGGLLIPSTNRHLPVSIDGNTALLLFLAWLGALVLFFAAKSWVVHRWPERFEWQASAPRDPDRAAPLVQFGIVAVCAGLGLLYLAPGPVLSALSGGAIEADRLAYTADFLQPLRAWGFVILLTILAGLHAHAGIARRWSRVPHILSICFLISAGIQLNWHASYGHVFSEPAVDDAGRIVFQSVGGVLILLAAVAIYREWTRVAPRTVTA